MSKHTHQNRIAKLDAKIRDIEALIISQHHMGTIAHMDAIRARLHGPISAVVPVSVSGTMSKVRYKGPASYRQWKLYLVHRMGGKIVNYGKGRGTSSPFYRTMLQDNLKAWQDRDPNAVKDLDKRKTFEAKRNDRMQYFADLLASTPTDQSEQIAPSPMSTTLPVVEGQSPQVLCISCGIPTDTPRTAYFMGDRTITNRVKESNLIVVGCVVKITDYDPVVLDNGDQVEEEVVKYQPVSHKGPGCPACQVRYQAAQRKADKAYTEAIDKWTVMRAMVLKLRDTQAPGLTDNDLRVKGPSKHLAWIDVEPRNRADKSLASYYKA